MPLKKELIYIDGKNRTDDIVAYRFYGTGFIKNNCAIKFKNSTKEYPYNANKIKIVKSAINSEKASNLFQYLNQIAANVGLTTEEGHNILADSYSKITFIPEYSILANFLNGLQPTTNNFSKPIRIFPFGFNLSQKDALNKAFNSPLSVIEGPPGTGKTQTILNIIANAVMNGQSVAVVSSNNSATKNVYEKLQKNGIEFIAALLGNSTNKQEFIDSQTDTPDLAQFNLSDEEKTNIKQTSENLFNQLTDYLQQKNELALLKQELDSLTTEYKHFQDENKIENDVDFFKSTTADNILALWVALDNLALTNKKLTWWRKLLYWFRYGRNEKTLFDIPTEKAILICQAKYYPTKIKELKSRQNLIEIALNNFSFDNKMKEFSQLSMQLFKSELYAKYNLNKRKKYDITDLRFNSESFLNDYPVIMSTTYSLRRNNL